MRAWGSADPSAYDVTLRPASARQGRREIQRALGPGSALRVETRSPARAAPARGQPSGLSRLTQIATLVLIAAVLAMSVAMGDDDLAASCAAGAHEGPGLSSAGCCGGRCCCESACCSAPAARSAPRSDLRPAADQPCAGERDGLSGRLLGRGADRARQLPRWSARSRSRSSRCRAIAPPAWRPTCSSRRSCRPLGALKPPRRRDSRCASRLSSVGDLRSTRSPRIGKYPVFRKDSAVRSAPLSPRQVWASAGRRDSRAAVGSTGGLARDPRLAIASVGDPGCADARGRAGLADPQAHAYRRRRAVLDPAAPSRRRLLRLLVAYQTIWDFLDD